MSLELRHLKAVVAVAESLNFRKAAERLHTAQPALSRTVADAERIVGFRLFERSTRVVTMTAAARALLPEIRGVLERLNLSIVSAQRTARGELGTITIGYNEFAIAGALPKVLMRFRRSFPEINVRLNMMTSPGMIEMIEQRSVDIGFLTASHLPPQVTSTVVRRETLVCVAPLGHRLAQRRTIRVSELADEEFVMGSSPGWDSFLEVVDAFCLSAGFKPKVVQEADFSHGLIGLVSAGLGVSIYVDHGWLHDRGDIAISQFQERTPTVTTVAAWHADTSSKMVGNFVEELRSELADAG